MSALLISVFVAGRPKTKGSLVVRPNGSAHEGVIGSPKWRALMAGAVRDQYAANWIERVCARHAPDSHPFSCATPVAWPGAVEVCATFQLPVDPLTSGAGDLDKLLRNVLDAIASNSKNPRYNGGVIFDDNQVVRIEAEKRGPSDYPGASIEVWTSP